MTLRLQFLGSGDAFGSGGRFNTCFHVTAPDTRFLIDCGASSMVAIRRYGIDPNAIDTVFVTHLHGDHFGGLPFLLLDAQLVSRRTRPLVVAGPPGLAERTMQACENFFPGSTQSPRRFALEILELAPDVAHEINAVRVTPTVVKHFCGAPPYALRLEAAGRAICYSGDTEWVDGLASAARGADLFIAEAYFFDKPVKWHLDYATLRARLDAIGARRVILTHMSADMLGRLAEVDVETAEDGLVVEI